MIVNLNPHKVNMIMRWYFRKRFGRVFKSKTKKPQNLAAMIKYVKHTQLVENSTMMHSLHFWVCF